MQKKMKIEFWSDVMYPFCYIGKTNFEAVLALFYSVTFKESMRSFFSNI